MIVKTETIGDRLLIHERGQFKLTIATAVEDGALCIALVNMDDSLTPLDSGILCAKLKPEITQDQAEVLLDYMNEVIDSWEMKWSPTPTDDPGYGIVDNTCSALSGAQPS